MKGECSDNALLFYSISSKSVAHQNTAAREQLGKPGVEAYVPGHR